MKQLRCANIDVFSMVFCFILLLALGEALSDDQICQEMGESDNFCLFFSNNPYRCPQEFICLSLTQVCDYNQDCSYADERKCCNYVNMTTSGSEENTPTESTFSTSEGTTSTENIFSTSEGEFSTDMTTSISGSEETTSTESNFKNSKVSIECTGDSITVSVNDTDLMSQYIYFDDKTCLGISDGENIVLKTGLNQCGTKIKFPSSTEITYYNHVRYIDVADGKVFSRTGEVEILAECTYLRYQSLSYGSFSPNYNLLSTNVEGFGSMTFYMNMYKSSNFAETYSASDFPVSINIDDKVFVGISVDSLTPGLELLIASCKASSRSNPIDDSGFTDKLILDGCPSDETVQYLPTNNSFTKHFCFKAFTFVDRSPEVYLHCEAVLCDSDDPQSVCKINCPDQSAKTNRRRSTSQLQNTERNIITIGPIGKKSAATRDLNLSISKIKEKRKDIFLGFQKKLGKRNFFKTD